MKLEAQCPSRKGPTEESQSWLPVVDKLRTLTELDLETVVVLSV